MHEHWKNLLQWEAYTLMNQIQISQENHCLRYRTKFPIRSIVDIHIKSNSPDKNFIEIKQYFLLKVINVFSFLISFLHSTTENFFHFSGIRDLILCISGDLVGHQPFKRMNCFGLFLLLRIVKFFFVLMSWICMTPRSIL